MLKFVFAFLVLFCLHAARADEPSAPPGGDDSAAESESTEMKETGGFQNMKAETDYDAPEPERDPASDDGDKADDPGPGEG